MAKVSKIIVVMADWCPHCVPTTVEAMERAAKELGAVFQTYNIDDLAQERLADEIVKKYGDWSPNYLIPQVFFEYSDGSIEHVLTGQREGVWATKEKINELVQGPKFAALKATS
jgi:thiol-disulfide isomerase/thioredoxin